MSDTIEYPPEIRAAIVEGKNPTRVYKGYLQHPKDWIAQYNMLLMDGVVCSDCVHCSRCTTLFDQKELSDTCQFYPNRFKPKP